MVIIFIIEVSVVVGCFILFFIVEEIQFDVVIVKLVVEEFGEEIVIICDVFFFWNCYENKDVLYDVNFFVYKGELFCIVGCVGVGKSFFLQSVFGDFWKVKGDVEIRGLIVYVSQIFWIMNVIVKENIIFGYCYDFNFYERIVKVCVLFDDFVQFFDGDEIVVGECGIFFSGG